MSPCCFGVEPRADGSSVVAAQAGEHLSVQRFAALPAVVQFVRARSRSPRICIAALGAGALALAFGELPDAEVIRLRPAALPSASQAAAVPLNDDIAVALARYARRAA